MPKKAPVMPPALDHLIKTVSAAARHVGTFYNNKGIQDEATYEMALRAELGVLGLQVVKNKAVEIGYTTSTGVTTTVATHYVDLFVTNPHVDSVSAVACELKVLTTTKLTDVHRQQSVRYAHFLGIPVLLIGFAKHTGDVLIECVLSSLGGVPG